jgi:hypothetical protein
MKHGLGSFRVWALHAALVAATAACLAEGPQPVASAGFDRYVGAVEARIGQDQRKADSFLVGLDAERAARLRQGHVVVERLTPEGGEPLPGALLHDWRGTAFVPGATTAEFENMLRDFADYPTEFSPQVLEAKLVGRRGDLYQMEMLVRQRHVLVVTLDGDYDVRFGQLDPEHGWSASRSARIREIASDGYPLSPSAEHGFLWRLDTWWTYEERDGGLYVQIETVSLTRSIPAGLGWAVGPFVENIPRESLEFTLRSACAAVRHPASRPAGSAAKGERH